MLKSILSLMLCVVLFVASGIILSQAENDAKASVSLAAAAWNVGNKVCPVMGNPIVEDTKATYEYQGKVYNFCCEACIEEFKANPEKYIKIIEQEKNSPQPLADK
jgi:YHS domain-containing protein